ncbi:hypothetical protein KP509_27G016200 [Ceratopteris richardii]|uniref:Uncharacterized protein n=1 Tax=Ceratopteris richardii TaxID=49495 RepID=A0A8T2RE44_CERRI|nr:hypothetical protein KP509_27G016200 [Ceratopteris richardii]KAH7294742.1 hypothetical protein KP509_27G016200 [Ceratopteris richardii]
MATGKEAATSELVWTSCALGQLLGAGVVYSRGHGTHSMPFRAFSIASLLVGSAACATTAAVQAAGVREIEDIKELGRSFRQYLEAILGKSQ